MSKKKLKSLKKPLLNVIYPCIAVALMLAIWAIFAAVKNKPFLYPSPAETLKIFFSLGAEDGFFKAVFSSIGRSLLSFLISFICAFTLAVVNSLFEPLHKIFTPVVSVLRSAPTMAVILLCMLWLYYSSAPVLIGFLVAFPIMYQSFYTAITGVDKGLTEMAEIYKIPVYRRITGIYIPCIAGAVFDVSQSTVSLTFKVVIAAEVLCYTKNSVGFNMIKANLGAEIALLAAWTIVAVIISFIAELFVILLKKAWEAAR